MADVFATIDLGELEQVSGGRYTKGKQSSTEMLQALMELAKALPAAIAAKQQGKQQQLAQMMQMMGEMKKNKTA